MIAALADAIRGSARRRKVRAWVLGGAVAVGSAAAAAVLSLGAYRGAADGVARGPALPVPTQAVPAQPAPYAGFTTSGPGAAPVVAGETVAAQAEAVELTAPDGTSVRVEPKSELTLVRADAIRWLQLQSGSLEAHVAKLAPGARFVVATPDRQVEVHGTRFHVSLVAADEGCGGGTVTRVRVDEGVVTVRGSGTPEEQIMAGGQWPSGCAPRAAEPSRASTRAKPARHQATSGSEPAVVQAPQPSTLAAENDLFAAAVRAERAGDSAAALRALDELVARYPSSPLRGPAESERARITSHAAPAPAVPASP